MFGTGALQTGESESCRLVRSNAPKPANYGSDGSAPSAQQPQGDLEQDRSFVQRVFGGLGGNLRQMALSFRPQQQQRDRQHS
eukprot:m51a1_g3964 hypothetical protein (82) ;mRNA; r:378227-378472